MEIIVLLRTFEFFTWIISKMNIFNAHLRMASNISLEYIILTNRKYLWYWNLSLEVSTTYFFKGLATARQVQTWIQNALSMCIEAEFALCLLGFYLPEEPTATLLLPSHYIPVPILEPQELFDLLIIVCFHIYFQNNIDNIICSGTYMS